MTGRDAWVWAAATALAVPLYFALSRVALVGALERSARADAEQWRDGWRWDFDRRDDLAGPTPAAIARGGVDDSILNAPEASLGDFVSLNLRGQEIDAHRFTRLRLRIRLERSAPLLVFFRESLDGPDLVSPPLPLAAGWQELDVALDQLAWREHLDPTGPDDRAWGGESGTVASLRLHPIAAGRAGFALDWIALEPPAAAPPRELVTAPWGEAASVLARRDRPAVLVLGGAPLRPAPVMALRSRIEQDWPATSVVLREPAANTTAARAPPGILLAAGLGLALGALIAGRRRRPAAAAMWLAAIAVAGAGLLSSPIGAGAPVALLLAAGLGAVVLGHALTSLRGRAAAAFGSAAAWRTAGVAALIGLAPLVIAAGRLVEADAGEIALRWFWYLPWAAFQQLLLLAVLYPLARALPLPPTAAAALAAVLFGLGHYPNLELMLGTFGLAAACLALYRRRGAIAPLAVLHATLGTAYLSLLPPAWLYSGAVGMRFFT